MYIILLCVIFAIASATTDRANYIANHHVVCRIN